MIICKRSIITVSPCASKAREFCYQQTVHCGIVSGWHLTRRLILILPRKMCALNNSPKILCEYSGEFFLDFTGQGKLQQIGNIPKAPNQAAIPHPLLFLDQAMLYLCDSTCDITYLLSVSSRIGISRLLIPADSSPFPNFQISNPHPRMGHTLFAVPGDRTCPARRSAANRCTFGEFLAKSCLEASNLPAFSSSSNF